MKKLNKISRRSFLKAAAYSAAALSALALTGCSGSASTAGSAGGSEGGFKVGIVNYVDDASLNQIVASLEARLDEIGAEKGSREWKTSRYAGADIPVGWGFPQILPA